MLKAPFPYFGGKSRAAALVWDRFGDVPNYVEPFAGSLAVLLGRPHPPRVETVNDIDAMLANFWRSIAHDPDAVAKWADWPVNESDLHPRHRWLVEQIPGLREKLEDPDAFDAKIAGWWVWGQCLWIGAGWCQRPDWEGRGHAAGLRGRGIHGSRRWQGGGRGGGSGVHAPSLTSGQLPHLSGASSSAQRGYQAKWGQEIGLYEYMRRLSARLRRVRVCRGDWTRVLTPSVTTYIGVTGVFLDPPYSHDLRERCYAEDHDISADVRAWAIAHGDDPKFRIALCGYEDEHGDGMPASWSKVAWKAHGGYSRTEAARENATQERIWFSPHCLKPEGRLNFEEQSDAV